MRREPRQARVATATTLTTTATTNAPDFPGWTMEHVYTMCVWSAYAEFLKLRCVNLPGM